MFSGLMSKQNETKMGPRTTKVLGGAALAGGVVVGAVAGSVVLGIAGAGAAAYAATRGDKVGDAARAMGTATVAACGKAKAVDQKYHITSTAGSWLRQGYASALEFNTKHGITDKTIGGLKAGGLKAGGGLSSMSSHSVRATISSALSNAAGGVGFSGKGIRHWVAGGALAEVTQQVTRHADPQSTRTLLACLCGVCLLWDSAVIFPLKILAIFFHELSHGLAAVATGGEIVSIELFLSEGGK